MGIKTGPRKKILKAIKERTEKVKAPAAPKILYTEPLEGVYEVGIIDPPVVENFEMQQTTMENGNSSTSGSQQPTPANTMNLILTNQNVTPSFSPQPGPSNMPSTSGISNDETKFSRYGSVRATLAQYPSGEKLMNTLDSDPVVDSLDRRALVRIVVAELTATYAGHYVPAKAKLSLAKAIVREFPQLREKDSDGHERFYNEDTGHGFLEFQLWTRRKKLPLDQKKYKSKKTVTANVASSPSVISLDKEVLKRKVDAMKFKHPTEGNKREILQTMLETADYRKQWIFAEKPTVAKIFELYPRLLDYQGDLIQADFRHFHQGKADLFLEKFSTFYTPRILAYAKNHSSKHFKDLQHIEDENLKAMLLLTKLIPLSNANNAKRRKGRKRVLDADVEKNLQDPTELVMRLAPEGTHLPTYVSEIVEAATSTIQPYMIVVKGQAKYSFYLQVDSSFVEPENGSSVAAMDLLFKMYHVLNVEYPKKLENFFCFVQHYIYEIKTTLRPVVRDWYTRLSSVEIEE